MELNNPHVINYLLLFRESSKSNNILYGTYISDLTGGSELKFLPPKRMNFRQFIFITGGGFFFAGFLLIFQKKAG
ncbi:MAG TPA: hypothetical protein PKA90_10830 [Ignavibacteria bacterium]|nr:hypothetical protein [Ignavibacteria bacterium]